MDYSYLASFLKMLFALAVVLGIMLGALYLLKRIAGHNLPGSGPESLINILSTRYLGPKSSIMMVEVAGRVLIVGVTVNAINLLGEIGDDKTVALIRERSLVAARPGAAAFPADRYRAAMTSMLELVKKRRNKENR